MGVSGQRHAPAAPGSVLYKKKFRETHVMTEENLDDIGARLEASPKLLRLLALQCGLGNVQLILVQTF
jgi:hypothetical protein